MDWLSANSGSWAQGAGASAYAVLILSAHATGVDPTHFGTSNLVAQLEAAGPTPAATAAASTTAGASPTATAKKSSSSFNPWWIIGVGLVAGAGIGMYISFNRSRRRA